MNCSPLLEFSLSLNCGKIGEITCQAALLSSFRNLERSMNNWLVKGKMAAGVSAELPVRSQSGVCERF